MIKYLDWSIFTTSIILSLIGLMMIYSTGLSSPATSNLWLRQLLFFGIGLAGLIIFASIDYRTLRRGSTFFYLLSLLLLAGVLIFGLEIRGSSRWFSLGFFNFQPSEFSKFALLIIMAKFMQGSAPLLVKFRYVLTSAALALIPAFLIMLEPDLGSAFMHIAIWLGLLLVSPMPKRYLLYLLIIFLIVGAVAWQFFLADYQKDRVLSFLNPTADPLGRGYNVIQSMVAVGAGGVFGRGLARGLQSQLKFLPERQTDFIFASTVEELGILGGGLILLLFLFLFYKMIKIISHARDAFGTYLASGIFFLLLVQTVVNIAMNLGLLPVTGVTLPFLSYGGSSLVITMWFMGILQNISRKAVTVRFA